MSMILEVGIGRTTLGSINCPLEVINNIFSPFSSKIALKVFFSKKIVFNTINS
jgi:hypothetical protein